MSFLVAGLTTLGGAGGLSAGIGVAGVGMSLLGGAMRGIGAMGNKGDVRAGRAAAGQIYEEKLGLLGEQQGLSTQAAQSQFAGGQRDVSMGAQAGMRGIQTSADVTRAQSGLATSGTIEQQVQTQTGDLMAKYKSDMTKLFETRDLSKAEADLSYRSGQMSAEESYQSTLTGLESQPTTFLEGMFS